MIMSVDDSGRKQVRYSQSEWDWFRAGVDQDIREELSGKSPPGRHPTWPEYWEWRIHNIETIGRNPQTKVNYIMQRRKFVGLPDLSTRIP
jgi:hypothetical protein